VARPTSLYLINWQLIKVVGPIYFIPHTLAPEHVNPRFSTIALVCIWSQICHYEYPNFVSDSSRSWSVELHLALTCNVSFKVCYETEKWLAITPLDVSMKPKLVKAMTKFTNIPAGVCLNA